MRDNILVCPLFFILGGFKLMILSNRKVKVAALSIVSNTTLIILKVVAGLLSGSVSIVSEAIHSGMDLVASIIAFFLSVFPQNQQMKNTLTVMEKLRTFLV